MQTAVQSLTQRSRPRLAVLPPARPRLATIVGECAELVSCAPLASYPFDHVGEVLVRNGRSDDRRDAARTATPVVQHERAASERFLPVIRRDAGLRSRRADAPAERERMLTARRRGTRCRADLSPTKHECWRTQP
jgi:hypothetical protein